MMENEIINENCFNMLKKMAKNNFAEEAKELFERYGIHSVDANDLLIEDKYGNQLYFKSLTPNTDT